MLKPHVHKFLNIFCWFKAWWFQVALLSRILYPRSLVWYWTGDFLYLGETREKWGTRRFQYVPQCSAGGRGFALQLGSHCAYLCGSCCFQCALPKDLGRELRFYMAGSVICQFLSFLDFFWWACHLHIESFSQGSFIVVAGQLFQRWFGRNP